MLYNIMLSQTMACTFCIIKKYINGNTTVSCQCFMLNFGHFSDGT